MRAGKSYVAPFEVGQPLEGGCVGVVTASRHPDFQAGDYVLGNLGWRTAWVSNGKGVRTIDPSAAPIQAYLGVMGMPGLTAYAGLLRIAELKDGETVLVSGAAGAVGSVVCQIAKAKGCRVVGIAGSEAKVAWLRDVAGVDAAINYRETRNLNHAIAQACPDGVDVYFDNVGADQLEAAIQNMKHYGRIAVCGMIAQYNAPEPPQAPRNLMQLVVRRLTMRGFLVFDHNDMEPDFRRDMAAWLKSGQVKSEETVFEGLEKAPKAFIGLFHGENLGKMLVKIADA